MYEIRREKFNDSLFKNFKGLTFQSKPRGEHSSSGGWQSYSKRPLRPIAARIGSRRAALLRNSWCDATAAGWRSYKNSVTVIA